MDQDTTHSRRLFTGIFFCSHSSITISSLIGRNRIPPEWADNDLAMMFVPIEIMKRHAKDTAETLRSLIQRVMVIEEMVATNSTVLDFGSLTGELHELNTLVVKLQRRWRFETTLIDSICEFIDYYQEPVSSVNLNLVDSNFTAQGNMIFNIGPKSEEDSREERESRDKLINTKEFRTLRSTAILQRRLSRTSEYDLSVLPERIKNAFAAVSSNAIQSKLKAPKNAYRSVDLQSHRSA
ncbi:hypothetical protein EIK77_003708 [Talaromyces pinophilus]|nr:hypothetical protein EIK77_003708 [Talaromyces pinophilus]